MLIAYIYVLTVSNPRREINYLFIVNILIYRFLYVNIFNCLCGAYVCVCIILLLFFLAFDFLSVLLFLLIILHVVGNVTPLPRHLHLFLKPTGNKL